MPSQDLRSAYQQPLYASSQGPIPTRKTGFKARGQSDSPKIRGQPNSGMHVGISDHVKSNVYGSAYAQPQGHPTSRRQGAGDYNHSKVNSKS